jgi:antitoxin ChpS
MTTTANLRNEGNTVVLPIPKPIPEQANLKAGAQVDIEIEGGKIVMAPKARPKYTLAELMAQCDLSRPLT